MGKNITPISGKKKTISKVTTPKLTKEEKVEKEKKKAEEKQLKETEKAEQKAQKEKQKAEEKAEKEKRKSLAKEEKDKLKEDAKVRKEKEAKEKEKVPVKESPLARFLVKAKTGEKLVNVVKPPVKDDDEIEFIGVVEQSAKVEEKENELKNEKVVIDKDGNEEINHETEEKGRRKATKRN